MFNSTGTGTISSEPRPSPCHGVSWCFRSAWNLATLRGLMRLWRSECRRESRHSVKISYKLYLVTWSVQAMRPGHAMGIIYTSGTTGQPKAAGSPGHFRDRDILGRWTGCSCSDASEVMIHHDAVVAQGAIGCLDNTGILEGDFRQSQTFEQDWTFDLGCLGKTWWQWWTWARQDTLQGLFLTFLYLTLRVLWWICCHLATADWHWDCPVGSWLARIQDGMPMASEVPRLHGIQQGPAQHRLLCPPLRSERDDLGGPAAAPWLAWSRASGCDVWPIRQSPQFVDGRGGELCGMPGCWNTTFTPLHTDTDDSSGLFVPPSSWVCHVSTRRCKHAWWQLLQPSQAKAACVRMTVRS